MALDETPWLIKSSGRIIGPFNISKVIELLKTREVSVLDEAASPLRRWETIQYHEKFKEVIEGLRRASLSEQTDAGFTPTDKTGGLTQTLTDLSGGELTDEISDPLSGFTNTNEIVVHNVQEQRRAPVATSAGRFQPQQEHGTAIQTQVDKTTRGLWIVTFVVLFSVGAFILQKRMAKGAFDAKPSLAVLKQSVTLDVQAGQYADALRELKAFFPDPTQSGEMSIYYGSLLLQVEGQTVLGRRLLSSVISSRRPEVKQAYTGLGIADLLDGQVDSAQENFDKALNVDPAYIPAVVNSASVSLKRGDYNRAKAISLKALQLSPLQGEALLTLAEAQLYLFKGNSNHSELLQVSRMLKDFLAKQWDYKGEIGFYGLYFDFLRQDKGMEEKLRDYLDRDPQLTLDHRHNVFIYKGQAQWKVLGRFCEQMAEKMGHGARVSALLASCYSRELRWDQARRFIENAVQASPKDALVQAWYSYILKESGEGNQASVVLARANDLNRRGEFVLPALLQARFSQGLNDWDGARESWQKVYERDLDYLPAVSGMAWCQSQKAAHGEASKLLEKGLKISPDYIPLLLLKQKAEREGWYVAN